MKLGILSVVGLLSGFQAAYAGPANVLVNGSFEDNSGPQSPPYSFAGWTVGAAATAAARAMDPRFS